MGQFLGRTGVVSAVNPSQKTVQLVFFFPNIAAKEALWLPFNTLMKPQRLWLVSQSSPSTQRQSVPWT